MKTIFTLLSSLIMSVAVIAAPAGGALRHKKSVLTVKSFDRGNIRVVLDGRRFEPGFNSVMIQGLEAGYHTLKIYRERPNGGFHIFGHRYEMVYSTSLMVRPKTHVRISVDRFGRTSIDERKIRGHGYYDRDGRGHDHDGRDRDNDWFDDNSFEFDDNGKMGDYDQHYGYERGMDDHEFRQVLNAIDKEWLETNKLKSATQVVRTNQLTAAQVKQLVLMFSFESNKLQLAKEAYRNTVDKRNYYIIHETFSFSSSKDELNRYTRNFR